MDTMPKCEERFWQKAPLHVKKKKKQLNVVCRKLYSVMACTILIIDCSIHAQQNQRRNLLFPRFTHYPSSENTGHLGLSENEVASNMVNHHLSSNGNFGERFQTCPNILWLVYTHQLYPQIHALSPMKYPMHSCSKHHFQARPGPQLWVVWVVPLLQGSTLSPFQASGSVQALGKGLGKIQLGSPFQMIFEAHLWLRIGVLKRYYSV